MKPLKIPSGWRKLRKGTKVATGDKFWNRYISKFQLTNHAGEQIGGELVYIRREQKGAK